MKVHLEAQNLKIYEAAGFPFLIIELSGMLQAADYLKLLSSPDIKTILIATNFKMVLLELNGVYVVGSEALEIISNEFCVLLSESGVIKFAVSVAEHIFPIMSNMFIASEKTTILPMKYFGDINDAAAWLKQGN